MDEQSVTVVGKVIVLEKRLEINNWVIKDATADDLRIYALEWAAERIAEVLAAYREADDDRD